jgi:hypothetical protein
MRILVTERKNCSNTIAQFEKFITKKLLHPDYFSYFSIS